jgi:hypothetical protein
VKHETESRNERAPKAQPQRRRRNAPSPVFAAHAAREQIRNTPEIRNSKQYTKDRRPAERVP